MYNAVDGSIWVLEPSCCFGFGKALMHSKVDNLLSDSVGNNVSFLLRQHIDDVD